MEKPAYEDADTILGREVRNADRAPDNEGANRQTRGGSPDAMQADGLHSTGMPIVGTPGAGGPVDQEGPGGDGRGMPGQETGT